MALTATEHSRFFCYIAKTIKAVQKHNKFLNSRKSYAIPSFLPTALPVGVSRLMPSSGGIKPLTCTIFDPTYFGGISRNHVLHIFPTRLQSFIMGNYLDFALKIAHRGNTGSHRGKRKLSCLFEYYICALLLVFLCFCSMA